MMPLIFPLAVFAVGAYALWRQFNPQAAQDVATSIETTAADTMKAITDLFPKAAPYADQITAVQDQNGIPNNYLAKLLATESSYDPAIISGAKRSKVGATGIAQFMPATAKELGINPTDPHASIDAAGKYLKQLFDKFGDWPTAIAAYNWGQGNVAKKGLQNAPAETVNYVQKIAGVDITKGQPNV